MLIDGKSFFDVPVKNKEERYEKIMSISKNNGVIIIGLRILFKTLEINCNKFKQAN